MKYRKLGNTGFDVSEIGFGTWQIGGKRWKSLSREDNVELLRSARDLGINIFDSAEVYGQYKDGNGYLQSESQELLGQAFKNRRDEVIYCVKLGQFDEYTHRSDYNPQRIVDQFNQSLRRLNTDYIDIVLVHAPSLAKVKNEKAITILQTLRALGKAKAVGYSFEAEPEHIKEAMNQDIDVVMLQYNLLERQCEDAIKKATKYGVGILVGGPFKRGYLTGRWKTTEDIAKEEDDYWKWNLKYNKDKVKHILDSVNRSLREVGSPKELRKRSLELVLSQPVASAIIGHRILDEVKENVQSLEKKDG